MKSISIFFTVLFILLTSQIGVSQIPPDLLQPEDTTFAQIYNVVHEYYESIPVEESVGIPEGGGRASFYKWANYWENRVGLDGTIESGAKQMELNLIAGITVCETENDDRIDWRNLGPFNSDGALGNAGSSNECTGYLANHQNQGRIESISVYPTNPDEILAGGATGGIWKTTNGGMNWVNVTYDEGYTIIGITNIIRHPENPDIIYASTGNSFLDGAWNMYRRGYGLGVIMSIDGGESWHPTGFSFNFPHSVTKTLVIDESSTLSNTIIYAVNGQSVFKYSGDSDAQGNWGNIFTEPNSSPITDLEIESGGTVWISSNEEIYNIPSGTITANLVDNYEIPMEVTVAVPSICNGNTNPDSRVIRIEINKDDHLVILYKYQVLIINPFDPDDCKLEDFTFLYRTIDSGQSWEISGQLPFDPRHNMPFAVSAYNSNVVYMEAGGDRCVSKTTNAFNPTGPPIFNSMDNKVNHVDVRFLGVYDGNDNDPTGAHDKIYFGNDGGLSRTQDGNEWIDITGFGLACTNYYGVGITETNSDFIIGGAQDNSINFFNEGRWFETEPGGDNGDVLIDPRNNTTIYQQNQTWLYNSTLTGNNTINNNNQEHFGDDHPGWIFPMLLNPNDPDEIFSGLIGLHVSPDNGVTWTRIENPINHPHEFVKNNRTSGVAMSLNNSDIIYYTVRGYWWDTNQDPNNNTDLFGGIMKADRSSGSWVVTDITNNLKINVGGFFGLPGPLSDVAVDPNDENIIWVTMGSFSDGKKVFQTTDGGDTWVNRSGCLPNIPFSAVVVQGGVNNRVYVGSDFGIFYLDDTMNEEWAFYGNNGPKNLVADLEINRCGNKIVAATQGSGLWEADLINNEKDVIKLTPGATTWSTPRSLYYDHIIPAGAILTIENTTVNIAKDVKITVEVGGRLIVKNSTLTNGCGDLWEGIEVLGDKNLSQFQNQGRLDVRNNSVIEYAKTAVRLGKAGSKPLQAGGIIFSNRTTFRNNIRAVEFYKYRNFHHSQPSITRDNRSYFRRCTFITDEDLPDDQTPFAFITMWSVDNIKIERSDFINENPNASTVEELGKGIYTLDASFNVTGCYGVCPTTEPCCNVDKPEFINLEYGVHATNSLSSRSFRVDKSSFENCRIGVYLEDVDFAQILRSDFKMGYTSDPDVLSVSGIVNSYGTQYKIEENSFFKSENSNVQTVGTIMSETGKDNNEVYKNTFDEMTIANVAVGDNADLFDGLAYFCNNQINSTSNDIMSFWGSGIRSLQGGMISSTQSLSAGNRFTQSGNNPESDILNDGTTNITYYYGVNSATEEPLYITPIKVNKVNPPLLVEHTCPSGFDGGIIVDPTGNFNAASNKYDFYRDTYASQIDNGDTDLLLTAIINGDNDLKDVLLGVSPYLSVAVIDALIDHEPLNNDDLFDVLNANPDVLRQASMIQKISTETSLGEDMLNDLIAESAIITDRGKLEMSVSYYKAEMNKYARDVIHGLFELPDNERTTDYQDELLLWMETNHSLPSSYNRVDYLKSLGDDAASANLLSTIPNTFSLNEKENLSYQSLNDVYSFLNQLDQDNKNESELDEDEIQSFELIAENGNGRGQIKAQNVLSFFYGKRYPYELNFPDEENIEGKIIKSEKLIEQIKSPKVSIHLIPNPASSELNVQYDSPSIYGNTGEILIVNIQGQELFRGEIDAQNKEFWLNVNKWEEGMYYCIYKPTSTNQKVIPFIIRRDN